MAKILLVEDEMAVREMLADELSANGHHIIEAINGDDGMKKMLDTKPDIILCDRAMAVVSGYQLLETIRRDMPDYNDIPFIFMTALTDPRDKAAVEHLKPDAYIEKPIDFKVLIDKIDLLLKLKK